MRLLGPILLAMAAAALPACAPEPVRGRLVEYRSGEPVPEATVTITQRGWGWSEGQLVWDRSYRARTRTGAEGRFELPLPAPGLAGSGATLEVEREGFQRLTEVPAHAGAELLLQTLPVPAASVPGGHAMLGTLADGRMFGWSFVENRPVADPAQADLFPLRIGRDAPQLELSAPAGGGLQFLSQAAQRIASPSYGHLLRYAEQAPADGYAARLRLDAGTPGTIFVRTRDARHAKLAFDPSGFASVAGRVDGLDAPVAHALLLPFAYNPRPGRALPFDPAAHPPAPDPAHAAAAAELPPEGRQAPVARSFELTVRDAGGDLVERVALRLEPGVPRDLACPQGRFQYRGVVLVYGDDGLARVRLSVHGPGFAFHGGERLVSRRKPALMRFQEYRGAPQGALEYELQVAPVDEATAAAGC
ncbi:carboxypeptidase-like regulatory domain-containing protein [Caldimonas tepidiphila]|uniref:carboxypeptidase-like regulatory domain-containing protein n=1 Tax=Caldimonas tepidiphila TaxID=2315841 RepID=UPI000E5B2E16|nr:carboxypeptidase-like regulatory domain-containing protein [Caldimonas tepidiphila]